MIQANELRIGNYVYVQSGKLVINRDSVYKVENINLQSVKKYEPIPLTEEWLLLFGFNKVRDYPVFRLSSIQVEYNGGDNLWRVNLYADSTVVKSVHHLQNLFFALKGEEL